VVLTARSERFNTNCAPDFFMMTNPSRQRLLERVAPAVQTLTVAEGMSQKVLDALRGGAASAADRYRNLPFTEMNVPF
jgi:hypothetical protein